jgi:hypothetical protein
MSDFKIKSLAIPEIPIVSVLFIDTNNMGYYTHSSQEVGAQSARQLNNNSTSFSTYENPTFGISRAYSSNWNKDENISTSDNSTKLYLVRFGTPFKNSSDTFSDNLDIKVDNITDNQPLTLAKYANDTIGDLTRDFKVIEPDKHAAISGSQAYRIVYSGIEENASLQTMRIMTINVAKHMLSPTPHNLKNTCNTCQLFRRCSVPLKSHDEGYHRYSFL